MDMTFTMGNGARVEGRVGPFTIATDQPPDATAPTPFTLFLASIGACAAYYVGAFCRERRIATGSVAVRQRVTTNAAGLVERVQLTIALPPGFPERYRAAVVRAANQCTVKKHLEHPPAVTVEAVQLVA